MDSRLIEIWGFEVARPASVEAKAIENLEQLPHIRCTEKLGEWL